MEICGNWGLHIAMVQCLYQSNDYMKRKLREWTAQKCNFPVRAKTVPSGAGLQITPFFAEPYRADNEKCGNWGLPITMVPCLHLSNDYIKRKLRVWKAQKCNFLVSAKNVPTGRGLQIATFLAAPYRAGVIGMSDSPFQ